MSELKQRTLTEANIVQDDGYYHYVNHQDKLMTTGFRTKEALLKYTGDIRFGKATIILMQKRYELYQRKEKNKI